MAAPYRVSGAVISSFIFCDDKRLLSACMTAVDPSRSFKPTYVTWATEGQANIQMVALRQTSGN
jgi:hypothetical protein